MSSVTIAGLGAIGSNLPSLVARTPGVTHIVLVDPDRYDESNISTQNIGRSAPGDSKVEVQAALIHAINPRIRVSRFCEAVENVPLQQLNSCVLLSCVDNRGARQALNRIAWRCGMTLIDAAINAPSLVRLNVYNPDRGTACVECGWGPETYALLEQTYPCNPVNTPVAATRAPAELGALAATLQAVELRNALDSDIDGSTLEGAQLMLDTATYQQHLAHFKVNRKCRFDHQIWCISQPGIEPRESTLADLFDVLDSFTNPSIRLEGHSFARRLACIECTRHSNISLSLYQRFDEKERSCACGGRLFAPGFYSLTTLTRADLSPAELRHNLTALGLRDGDVITVEDASGSNHHIEIGNLQHHE